MTKKAQATTSNNDLRQDVRQLSTDVRHLSVLVEVVLDQNKAVHEAVGTMQQEVKKIAGLEKDMAEVKKDVKIIKAVVTDTSRQVHDHETRITRLEVKAA